MRSSVTVIFSNPPPDTTMSYPDYNQTAEDHQSLLVLVKLVGDQLKAKAFNRVYERISRLQFLKIQEPQSGSCRGIWVRYKRNYPVENNEWGDFQAHRKVLGLICIGKCNNQSELEELCRSHDTLKEQYNSTLFDSRCIVFGMNQESNDGIVGTSHPQSNSIPRSSTTGDDDEEVGQHSEGGDVSQGVSIPVSGRMGGLRKQSSDSSTDRDSGVFDSQNLDGGGESPGGTMTGKSPRSGTSGTSNGVSEEINGKPLALREPEDSASGSVYGSPLPQMPSPSGTLSRSCTASVVSSLPPSPTNCTGNTSDNSPLQSGGMPNPLVPPQNFKTQVLFYSGMDECSSLESDLYDFLSSLFWVLESKRLDRSHEKLDRVPLLYAPYEKKNFVGLDMDSRTNKKRCQGRMKKHIGDLSMLAGLPGEAINHYTAAVETLKSINDWLWLGGAYEGLCTASVVTMYPRQRRLSSLQRNSSFTAGSSPFNGRSRHEKSVKGTDIPAIRTTQSGFIGTVTTHSLPSGIDPAEFNNKNSLSPNDIIDRYRESTICYSKNPQAGIIETEANIKATRVLIQQNKYLLAAEFLQQVVLITLQTPEEEKIQRFTALSQLYTEIGFHRKAAFFKRIAAMRCVSPQNTNPNWSQCYHLLLQTLEGYNLSLDSKEFPKDVIYGWPALQIQILQELVSTSRRMGNPALSVRHMTFLLHSMFNHLTLSERRDFPLQLEALTSKCEGAPVPLALDNGYIIPAVNLFNLPRVKSFKLQNLAPHLRPIKMVPKQAEKMPTGPFIFSPFQFGQRDKNRDSSKMDFKWVEGDVCEVAVQVYNPLPFELKVTNMGLLPDGIAFETFPSCLSLPAESGPYPVNLLGIPRSTGVLEILGYTTHVLGVKSNCRLRDIASIKKPKFTVEVVPALPQIQVMTSLRKSATFSSFGDSSHIVTSMALNLFAGESQECTITLMNSGKENVEQVEISLESRLDKELEKQFCTWSIENLKTQLPVVPGGSASFTLYINAAGDFSALAKACTDEGSETGSLSSTHSRSKSASRASSVSSTTSYRSVSQYSSFQRKSDTPLPPPVSLSPKVIEAILKFRYTGGPGLTAKYCRQCAVAINVEVCPSISITKWDVLPAERPSHCYLVLDIRNTTEHEMEVHYTTNKHILIEAKETCRIPVPVERCPLSKLNGLSKDELEKVCQQHVANLVDIKWTIPTKEIGGNASIANLSWSPVMLDLIRMAPIQWEISLNDKQFKPEFEFAFLMGETINLDIIISNYSETMLSDLLIKVECYQDHHNGYHNYRLENKVAFIGCDRVNIAKIQMQETYHHHCVLIFFSMGVYKLEIQCSSGTSGIQQNTPNVAARLDGHVWKCMPAIELSITDK